MAKKGTKEKAKGSVKRTAAAKSGKPKGVVTESAKPDKSVKQHAEPIPPAAVKPGFWAYVRAVRLMALSWAKRHRYKLLLSAIAVLAVAGGLSAWLSSGDRPLSNDDIVIRVSRELGITGDGNPAILTVEDETKVSQPFLEEAKNGDKVLLYYKSGRSALYRPSEDRVIRHGTYTPPDAKLFLRDGGADETKMAAAKDKLKDVEGIRISSQDVSVKRDYARTLVVSVTDRYPQQAAAAAEALGAEVARLPRGETIPDADILIIVGAE